MTRSTLSLSVGGFTRRLTELKKSQSCDGEDGAVILYPGISRTRERRDRAKTKPHRRKGDTREVISGGWRIITNNEAQESVKVLSPCEILGHLKYYLLLGLEQRRKSITQ